jgi:hypothetical protein
MLTRHVALISTSDAVSASALQPVSAAIQLQVTRDFGPLWGVEATIDSFSTLDDVPLGYWQVVIKEQIDDPDALGYHTTDHNQPYALIKRTDDWTITTSHEVLEMLADPFGNRLVSGPSVKEGQGSVQYLVEVCDPSEAKSYQINNDVWVSDFYTPHFFDPVPSGGVRYDYTNDISAPRQIVAGGYLSWFDPVSQHWFQQRWFDGAGPVIVDLNEEAGAARTSDLKKPGESLREMIDRLTPSPRLGKTPSPKALAVAAARRGPAPPKSARAANADHFREMLAKWR